MNHKVITRIPVIEVRQRVIEVEREVPCNIPMPSLENLNRFKNRNLYYVMALGEKSYMNKGIIQGNIFIPNCFKVDDADMRFIPVKYWYTNWDTSLPFDFHGPYFTQWSLKDCNVIPNNYNNHKLFYCKKCAEAYMLECREKKIGLKIPACSFSLFGFNS